MKHVIYLHGFASSANGRKAQYLRPRFAAVPDLTFHAIEFSPTPADFEYLTISGMLNRLRQYILDQQIANCCLIGSSMGALVGLNYAYRFGDVERLLLLAPALVYLSGERVGRPVAQWRRQGVRNVFHYGFNQDVALRFDLEVDGRFYQPPPPPPPAPITIIHGVNDEVVPIDDSRQYAARYAEQVQLIEVEAGHDINAHLDLIWQITQKFLLATT